MCPGRNGSPRLPQTGSRSGLPGSGSPIPGGEDKQAAIREWDKLQPDDVLLREMALGLARDMQSPDWQRGIGIPYACRWLKHRRWEDEHRTPPQEPEPQPEQTLPKGAYRL